MVRTVAVTFLLFQLTTVFRLSPVASPSHENCNVKEMRADIIYFFKKSSCHRFHLRGPARVELHICVRGCCLVEVSMDSGYGDSNTAPLHFLYTASGGAFASVGGLDCWRFGWQNLQMIFSKFRRYQNQLELFR